MQYRKPSYFDTFKCTADQCPDTCCAGWQIVIDEPTLDKYISTEGAWGKRLLNGIDWHESCFYQNAGRCSMLNDNNLCDLVTAFGEEALCETCHRYPRHVEEFEGLREWSLSLSCPVAAKLILECEEQLQLLEETDDTEDPLEDEFEDFDYFLFLQLEEARKVLFDIVRNRRLSIEARMCLLLEFAEEMQSCLDEDRLCDMDNLIASYTEKEYDSKEDAKSRFLELQKQFEVLERLERLREEWTEVLQDARNTLYTDCDSYCRIRREFLTEYEFRECFRENILLFFLYTYFCGAVYDGWIYSKVALAVFSTSFLEEFVMCKWFLADKNISWKECIEVAYRYAREVEHSDENLNLLEEWLQENRYNLKGTEQ